MCEEKKNKICILFLTEYIYVYVYNLKQKNDRKEIKTRPLKYTVTEYFLN